MGDRLAMKVYLNFEGTRKKIGLSKKWVAEKDISDILQLFVDDYNTKNPGGELDIGKMCICEMSGTEMELTKNIGEGVQEYQDLLIQEKTEVVAPFVEAVLAGAAGGAPVYAGGKKEGPATTKDRF